MLEITTTRHNPLVDPHLSVWSWEIPLYLFVGGIVAGLMILGGIALLRLARGEDPKGYFSLHAPLAAFMLLNLGMLALFLDLAHKLYVWAVYLTFEPASPMSWGSWVLIIVYPLLLVSALIRLPEAWPWLGQRMPQLACWSDALLASARKLRWLAWANIALGVALGIYTGILLSTMVARPLWNVPILGPLFLVSGLSAGAVNIPYPAWDEFVNRLPADKNTLLVFFCQSVTCQMSPLSQRKAIALGDTNTKVYHQSVPEWETKDYLATTPEFVKAAYIDKDIPAVILDVRSAEEVAAGHIEGAVGIPAKAVRARLWSFPDPKFKAPIIVYGGRGGADAICAARALVKAAQANVQVIAGGLLGWQAAGYTIESGVPALTKVAYAPKPRPGAISADEFRRLATNTPPDVLILDVRNRDEASAGMIKGALLIPDEELAARMKELPKDKRIVAHCSTGIRAEMAYHRLKDAGYKAGFMNADIDIATDGSFKLTPKLSPVGKRPRSRRRNRRFSLRTPA